MGASRNGKNRVRDQKIPPSRQTTLPQSDNAQLAQLMRQLAAQQTEMQGLREQLGASAAAPTVVKLEAAAPANTPGDASGVYHSTKEAPHHLVKSLQRSTNLCCNNNLKSGVWAFGCTISTIDDDSLDDAVKSISTATPGFSYQCVRDYIKNRLTYMKCQKTTLGRWKLKTTKECPRGFFQRFDGPARGVRVSAEDNNGDLPRKEITETVLKYFESGQPTEGPLYEAFWALPGVQYVKPTDVQVAKPADVLGKDRGEKVPAPIVAEKQGKGKDEKKIVWPLVSKHTCYVLPPEPLCFKRGGTGTTCGPSTGPTLDRPTVW